MHVGVNRKHYARLGHKVKNLLVQGLKWELVHNRSVKVVKASRGHIIFRHQFERSYKGLALIEKKN